MIRNWEFNYTTLDGLAGVSFEVLPESVEPPVELRRPTTGKKVPLQDVLDGKVKMDNHRLYERRSINWGTKSAQYVEVPVGHEKPAQPEEFRRNSGASGPSRSRLLRGDDPEVRIYRNGDTKWRKN